MSERALRRLLIPTILSLALTAEAAAQDAVTTVRISVTSAQTGESIAGAQAVIVGTRWVERTDSAGVALLEAVPTGTHMLRVRALGYAQFNALVDVSGDSTSDVFVQLKQSAALLPQVTVKEEWQSPWLDEFEQRRRRGMGRYITTEEIRKSHGRDLGDLIQSKIPTLRVGGEGPLGRPVYSMRGPDNMKGKGGCQVVVYIDGVRQYNGDAAMLPMAFIGGVEYYTPSNVPVQYREMAPSGAGSVSCGVMLIWSGP